MGKLATAEQAAIAKKESGTPLAKLKGMLNTEECRKRLEETMNENAGAFSASIIELFNSDKYLAQCDPAQVLAECFKAASLKIPINKQLGLAYVIPYYDGKLKRYAPQFQLGYRGFIQLAQRSGEYKRINCGAVYEGEISVIDKLSGMIELNGERISNNIVGYFAYIETLNGFSKALYMTRDEILAHAKRFSKTYRDGKFSGPWATDFDAMAEKTCLRLLISKFGVMSIDVQRAVVLDHTGGEIKVGESGEIETATDADYADVPDIETIDTETGEVINDAE